MAVCQSVAFCGVPLGCGKTVRVVCLPLLLAVNLYRPIRYFRSVLRFGGKPLGWSPVAESSFSSLHFHVSGFRMGHKLARVSRPPSLWPTPANLHSLHSSSLLFIFFLIFNISIYILLLDIRNGSCYEHASLADFQACLLSYCQVGMGLLDHLTPVCLLFGFKPARKPAICQRGPAHK